MSNSVRRKLVGGLLLLTLAVAGVSRKARTSRDPPAPRLPSLPYNLRHTSSADPADTIPLLSIPSRTHETARQRMLRIPVIQATPRRAITDQAESESNSAVHDNSDETAF